MTMSSTLDTAQHRASVAFVTTVQFVRRVVRTLHALITITRRHVPAWLGAALTLALIIPGPIDELLVLVVIAGFAAAKPLMRAELRTGAVTAWKGF